MRALLTIVGALLLWLHPAMGERHASVGSVRARDASALAGLDAARAPARAEAVLRVAPVTPAREGPGTSPLADLARGGPHADAARASRRTGRAAPAHAGRPRRLAFPTEATAPPRALS